MAMPQGAGSPAGAGRFGLLGHGGLRAASSRRRGGGAAVAFDSTWGPVVFTICVVSGAARGHWGVCNGSGARLQH
jgi:hypothetical protein